MITIHGRTRKQYYSGIAKYDMIKKVKENVSIPVIANGDITSPKKAFEVLKETGADVYHIICFLISFTAFSLPYNSSKIS